MGYQSSFGCMIFGCKVSLHHMINWGILLVSLSAILSCTPMQSSPEPMTPWGEIEAIARQKGISVARERYKQEANQLAERLQQRLIQPTPEEVRRRSYDLYLFTAFLHSWAINERRALPKDQVAGQDFIQNVWRPITNHATLARTLYPDLLRELEIINSQLPKEELDKPGFHWTEVYSKGLDQDLKAMDIVIKQLQQAAQIQE